MSRFQDVEKLTEEQRNQDRNGQKVQKSTGAQ
jgi:hypothetical protein